MDKLLLSAIRNDKVKIVEFSLEMSRKMRKGRLKYGVDVKVDPVKEAMEECIDLANYAMIIYFRLKKLGEAYSNLPK